MNESGLYGKQTDQVLLIFLFSEIIRTHQNLQIKSKQNKPNPKLSPGEKTAETPFSGPLCIAPSPPLLELWYSLRGFKKFALETPGVPFGILKNFF